MKTSQRISAESAPLREQWVDVTVDVDLERQVIRLIEPQGEIHEYVSGAIRALSLAVTRTGGAAQWCAKYLQLLIPGAPHGVHGGPFYKLTPARITLTA